MFCQQNLSSWFLIWKARRNWTALLPCLQEGKRHSKQRCSLPLPWVASAIRIPFLPFLFLTLELRDRSRTCDKPCPPPPFFYSVLFSLCATFAVGGRAHFALADWLKSHAMVGDDVSCVKQFVCDLGPCLKCGPLKRNYMWPFVSKISNFFSCHTAISHLAMMYVPCFFVCNTHTWWWGAF